ncbi:MAG TPA: aldo/keto reductase [Gemmatimonadaceae bacterium]|nr:aldo/keto reductase [Gemmatimonadaceae bacterium]
MDRASFLKWLGTTAGGRLLLGARAREDASVRAPAALPERRFGRTGLMMPILGLGGWHFGDAGSERAARTLLETAIAEGIRFLDNAESYHAGTAEQWLGSAIESLGVRKQVYVMTKTFDLEQRGREVAARHLEGSLRRLRTDHLDLWQLHSVRSPDDTDRAFRRGGAMEYIFEMQRQGVVRHVGVTGHRDPFANLRALHYWDEGIRFDAMQIPLNPMDYHQRSFQRHVLAELVKRDIAVIAMKTSADGRLLRSGVCTAAECHRFAWSLPVSLAVVGMERPSLVRENARFAREFRPMSEAERRALIDRVAPQTSLRLEPYKVRG